MRLRKTASGSVILSQLNAWELNTLRSVPELAEPDESGGIQRRLFPPPAVAEDLTPEMADDWVEFVVPDLRDRFRGALDTLRADVARAKPESPRRPAAPEPDAPPPAPPSSFRLSIPADHVEPWYLAMNQARLAMSARYAIDPADPPDFQELLAGGKLERWFQYELLCAVQSWLLMYVIDPDGNDGD